MRRLINFVTNSPKKQSRVKPLPTKKLMEQEKLKEISDLSTKASETDFKINSPLAPYNPEKPSIRIKAITIGDVSTGKTSIIKQFTQHKFKRKGFPTIAIEYDSKVINIFNHATRLEIWDTSGSEAFASITKSYFRSVSLVLVVFDITNEQSFKSCENWLKKFKDASEIDHSVLALVGNKADLSFEQAVSEEQAEIFAKENGMVGYFEVSAYNGFGLDEMMQELSEEVIKRCEKGLLVYNEFSSGVWFEDEDVFDVSVGEKRKEKKKRIALRKADQGKEKKCC